MAYILNRKPIMNLGKLIEFELDREKFKRMLVVTVRAIGAEISVASPVGAQLANAKPGDRIEIHRPGDECLLGKVLSIQDIASG